jgi:hypothetical protein
MAQVSDRHAHHLAYKAVAGHANAAPVYGLTNSLMV